MSFSAFKRYQELSGAPFENAMVTPEDQNSDYEAGHVTIGSGVWRIRTARITPKKPGAFVAVWKRSAEGNTEPFDGTDACEGLMVFVDETTRFGVFRFTREHLAELGVTRSASSSGKRGFRVYPSWHENLNKQALSTQHAQAAGFKTLEVQGTAYRSI